MRGWLLPLMLVCLSVAQAQQVAETPSTPADTLPDPLSLVQALQLVDEQHPQLLMQRLAVERAEASLDAANTRNALKLTTDARLRWVEGSSSNPLRREDHDNYLALRLSKPLYDSGEAGYLAQAANQAIDASSLQYAEQREQYSILVMRKFFEVILADLEAARDMEDMSIAYVRMDRAQDRHELGQVSDIDLLQLQSHYQNTRRQAFDSEGRARQTRIALALALNRPGQQPSQLTPPALDVAGLQIAEYQPLLDKVMAGNRQRQVLKKRIAAAQSRVDAARAGHGIRAVGEIERAEYSRDTGSTDKWRVGVQVEVPLYDGGRADAAVRMAQADLTEASLRLQQHDLDLHQQVRDLWEQVRVLTAEADASQAYADYRELYMDRSRALYELEVRTDLGDAMVEISRSHLRRAQQQFQLALALAQLNTLAGLPVTQWRALAAESKGSE